MMGFDSTSTRGISLSIRFAFLMEGNQRVQAITNVPPLRLTALLIILFISQNIWIQIQNEIHYFK
jgi:hypothetical protein